jgi:hypothetical protein
MVSGVQIKVGNIISYHQKYLDLRNVFLFETYQIDCISCDFKIERGEEYLLVISLDMFF